MNEKNTLKISGLRQRDGSFIFALPTGSYLVNGALVKVGYNMENITSSSLPEIQKVESATVITEYTNIQDGSILSIDEYLETEKNLLKSRKVVKGEFDIDEYYWDDIDKEFDYKKFKAKWQPVKNEFTKVIANVEVTIMDMQYSDNPYIVPVRHIGGDIIENQFVYCGLPSALQFIHEIAKKHGYTQILDNNDNSESKNKTYSYPTHSGLEFLKISNKYVFGSNNNPFNTVKGNYKECQEAFEKQYKILEDKFIIDKNSPRILKSKLAITALNMSKKTVKAIHSIEYKSKSRGDYVYAYRCINELVSFLEGILTEEDPVE